MIGIEHNLLMFVITRGSLTNTGHTGSMSGRSRMPRARGGHTRGAAMPRYVVGIIQQVLRLMINIG